MSSSKRCLLIDHVDSFTYNIKEWLEKDFLVEVVHYKNVSTPRELLHVYDLIILSPGPYWPSYYPETQELLEKIVSHIPIMGICLGMQLLGTKENETLEKLDSPMHGKKSSVDLSKSALGKSVGKIEVARYHSWGFRSCLDSLVTSQTDDHIVMSIESREKKYIGVQFHPESFMTEKRDLLRINVLHWLNEVSCAKE